MGGAIAWSPTTTGSTPDTQLGPDKGSGQPSAQYSVAGQQSGDLTWDRTHAHRHVRKSVRVVAGHNAYAPIAAIADARFHDLLATISTRFPSGSRSRALRLLLPVLCGGWTVGTPAATNSPYAASTSSVHTTRTITGLPGAASTPCTFLAASTVPRPMVNPFSRSSACSGIPSLGVRKGLYEPEEITVEAKPSLDVAGVEIDQRSDEHAQHLTGKPAGDIRSTGGRSAVRWRRPGSAGVDHLSAGRSAAHPAPVLPADPGLLPAEGGGFGDGIFAKIGAHRAVYQLTIQRR
jgi:hypothetical protein